MPIADSTIVKKVRKGRTTSSARREQEEKRVAEDETDVPATLFELKESKYHEDMFAGGQQNKQRR